MGRRQPKTEAEIIPLKQTVKLEKTQLRLFMITHIASAMAASAHYDKLDHTAIVERARGCVDEIEKQEKGH